MDDAPARVRLVGILFRECIRAYAAALAKAGLPPPRPEEKEALLRGVEETAWELTLVPVEREPGEWDDRSPTDPQVRGLVQQQVEALLARRRGAAT